MDPAYVRIPGPRSGVGHPGFSRSGRIAALLFSFPLEVPRGGRPQNKVLWVPRRTPQEPTSLRVRAQRMTGDRAVGDPVTRVLPDGPGPSTVDLPAAGCWRLRLAWADTSDELDVRYVPNRSQRLPATSRKTATVP